MWAVLGKFFQSLPVPCGVLCRKGREWVYQFVYLWQLLSNWQLMNLAQERFSDLMETMGWNWDFMGFHGWDETAPRGHSTWSVFFFFFSLEPFSYHVFFFPCSHFFPGPFFFSLFSFSWNNTLVHYAQGSHYLIKTYDQL